MKLIFNDSQYIEIQSITESENAVTINLINTDYATLKHLFADPVTTKKMILEDGTVYENYTVFSFIQERNGGIFIVEMFQEGKDVETRLDELTVSNEETAQELTNTQIALCENYEQGVVLAKELTNVQIAITEVYEMMLGGAE